MLYDGNFVDQGFYGTQEEVNDLTWIFPGDLAEKSMLYVADQAPAADAIVVTRRGDPRGNLGTPAVLGTHGAGRRRPYDAEQERQQGEPD